MALFGVAGFTVVAQRLSDDGHLGYVLAPVTPVEPDWPALQAGAQALLADVWSRRATARPVRLIARRRPQRLTVPMSA